MCLTVAGMYQCDKCECDFKVHSALERHMQAHALAAKTLPDPANIEEGRGFKGGAPLILLPPTTFCVLMMKIKISSSLFSS
jgi:hypothetical protein